MKYLDCQLFAEEMRDYQSIKGGISRSEISQLSGCNADKVGNAFQGNAHRLDVASFLRLCNLIGKDPCIFFKNF